MSNTSGTISQKAFPQPGNALYSYSNSGKMGPRAGGEKRERISAGKRTLQDANAPPMYLNGATAKDLNISASSNPEPVKKKKKATYPVPGQSRENGHFYVVLGEDVDKIAENPDETQRYKIISMLGEGTFGKVVEAWDRKHREYCAVKIVRNVPKYTRDAEMEIRFMTHISDKDKEDRYHFMKLRKSFLNPLRHMCIVMPKFGRSLLETMQKNGPFIIQHTAKIAYQMGKALNFLHKSMRMIHTDLKPENVLMENNETEEMRIGNTVKNVSKTALVRICDMGGCTDERHSKLAIVSTRHYRAPEVILGMGWMYPADMWSLGCILYELHTGHLLYPTHENREHLAMMEKSLGQLPNHWGPQVQMEDCKTFINNTDGKLVYPHGSTTEKSIGKVRKVQKLDHTVSDPLLADLIKGLLEYDKNRRLTAEQLCSHPFINKYYPEARDDSHHPENNAPPAFTSGVSRNSSVNVSNFGSRTSEQPRMAWM